MSRHLGTALVFVVLGTGGCTAVPAVAATELDRLASWMAGTFSSNAQHLADPDHYFDIRLVMVPIWTDRSDGPWLYVEQATAAQLQQPYRQRVYHLVAMPDGRVRSDVHSLPGDPLAFAGAWSSGVLTALAPDVLTLRDGCSLFLRRGDDGTYVGATEGTGCASERGGASHATAEATITATRLTSWDRGYDAAGNQVWGAEKGGYRFEKLASQPPAN